MFVFDLPHLDLAHPPAAALVLALVLQVVPAPLPVAPDPLALGLPPPPALRPLQVPAADAMTTDAVHDLRQSIFSDMRQIFILYLKNIDNIYSVIFFPAVLKHRREEKKENEEKEVPPLNPQRFTWEG